MDKKCKRRLITLLLSLALIITYMPTSFLAYAVDNDPAVTTENPSDGGGDVTDGGQITTDPTEGTGTTGDQLGNDSDSAGPAAVEADGEDVPEVKVDGAKGGNDTRGTDSNGAEEAEVSDNYHVSWTFRWANGGGSASSGYEFKNPETGDADSTYLFYHPQSWNYQNANLLLELTFSGEEDQCVKAGAIEVRIPLSVFEGWDGKRADEIVTQVPKAPETNAQSNFNYTIDEDTKEIVLRNFNDINGNDYLAVEFSYKVSPLDIRGGQPDEAAARTAGYTDPDPVATNATGGGSDIDRFCWNHNGKYLWKDYYKKEGLNCSITIDPNLDGEADFYDYDNPLSVAMMTRAGGYLRIRPMADTKNGVYTAWQSTWGAKPANADNYVYVIWNANYGTLTNYAVNQPYGIDMFYDANYPAITFGEGANAKIIYGEQVGKMLHTCTFMGGTPNNTTNNQYNILTNWGGDSSRGYYPNLGTDTTNTTNKNNHSTFFWSKHATKFYNAKTGQDYYYGYGNGDIRSYGDNTSSYQSPHFAVLVRYPIDKIMQYADEYNVDLEHDGIKIYGQYYSTETWESGYTIDRKARGVAQLFIVDRTGKGVFVKRHRADNFDSNVTQGAQTALSNGTQVDLDNYSWDGFRRYPYYIHYNGTSRARTVTTTDEQGNEVTSSALVPQRLILEEQQLMLSSAGAKHSRGWQPNGEDAAARPVGTGYTGDGNYFLTDDDYTIPRFDVLKFEDYQGTYSAGVWAEGGLLAYSKCKPMFVYIRYAHTNEYVPYCAVVKTSATGHTVYKCSPTETDEDGNPVIYKNSSNIIPEDTSNHHYALPKNVTGIKYVHDTTEDVFRTDVNVTVHVILKPTQAVMDCVNADLNHVNSEGVASPVNTYVKNIASYAVYEGNAEGGWNNEPRLSGDNYANGNGVAESVIWILNRITNSMTVEKSAVVPKDDDPAQQAANLQNMEIGYVKLQARNNAGISKNIVYPTDAEDPYKMLSGTFYELLPKGTNIRADSVFGVYNETWSSHQYSASKYTDWVRYKDRGESINNGITDGKRYFLGAGDYSVSTEYIPDLDQTLVRIDYSFADPRINSCPDSTWNCFVAFFFIIENPYANIRARGTSTQNYIAFENTTEGGRSAVASGSKITASNLNNRADIAALFQEKTADNSKRAGCAKAAMTWNAVTVLEAGYTKTVAIPESLNGLPTSEDYTSDGGRVTVNNRYIYRLQLTNMPTARADQIVLYDILESGTDAEDSQWQGKFVSVDTSLISGTPSDQSEIHATCKPVVYYSTNITKEISMTDPDLQQSAMFNLQNSEYWSKTCPDDPSTVTAIAIDCTKASNGTKEEDFHLGPKASLTAFVHMQAPEEMVKKQNGEIDVDAVALNGSLAALRPFADNPGDILPDVSWLMSRASLMLRDVNISLVKASDPMTGTPTARTIVDSDGTGTIVYRLRLRNTMPFDCNNIVVTDPIPQNLTIDKITVKLNGNENETDGDSTAGFAYSVAEDGRSLTFNIDQQHPTTETSDKDTYIYIYTKVDELVDADGKQIFLRDYDNQATLVSANDKPIGEDTEIMYHRAETVKIDVEKIWDDANDRYKKRPSQITLTLSGTYVNDSGIVTDAEIYKVDGNGNPVTDENGDPVPVQLVITSDSIDENGYWHGSFEKLSKYKVFTEDASFEEPNKWYEITYKIEEEPIYDPADTSENPQPIYEVVDPTMTGGSDGNYKFTVTNRYNGFAEIELTKKLDGFVNGGKMSNVTLAFRIDGYKKGSSTPSYTNYVGMTFNKNDVDAEGYYTKTIKLEGLPPLYTYKVTEVYSGNYTSDALNGKTAVYEEDKGLWTIAIDNTHNGYTPGSGVVNKYENGNYVQPGSNTGGGGEPSAGGEGN